MHVETVKEKCKPHPGNSAPAVCAKILGFCWTLVQQNLFSLITDKKQNNKNDDWKAFSLKINICTGLCPAQ